MSLVESTKAIINMSEREEFRQSLAMKNHIEAMEKLKKMGVLSKPIPKTYDPENSVPAATDISKKMVSGMMSCGFFAN